MFKKLTVSCFLILSQMSQAIAAGDTHGDISHDAGHHESTGGLPQLDPSSFPSQILWLFIVFIVMYVIFSKKTLPEISQTIENRNERIRNDLDTAERLKNEVTSVQENYEQSISSARKEAQKMFSDIEQQIKTKTEDSAKKFQERSSKKLADLEASIEKARETAMDEMSDIAAEVAAQAAEKIIGVKADPKSAIKVVKSIGKAA